MIGELSFNYGRRRVTARLSDRLAWECAERDIQDYLTAVFPAPTGARGDPGAAVYYLYQAGDRLGAEVRPSRRARELVVAGD